MVLLPGIGCGVEQFHHQREALAGSADVHGLDLPGHRGAAAVDGPATLAAVTERIAGRIADLAPGGAVVVGHSTGGVLGLQVAGLRPELVAALVMLDANVPVTAQALAHKRSRAAAALGPHWRAELATSMRTSWGPREPALREEVVAGILATAREAVLPLWADVLDLDPRPALAALRVPALHVRSSRDVDGAALAALNPRIAAVDLRARHAGHWPHLVEPVVVTGVLVDFLRRWSR